MPTERRIYIIELRPPWVAPVVGTRIRSDVRCFYVGETGKGILDRVAEHLTGDRRVAQCFKDARRAKGRPLGQDWRDTPLLRGEDVWLRTKLFRDIPAAVGNQASVEQEARVVDALRRQGHIVFPKGAGSEPFMPPHVVNS